MEILKKVNKTITRFFLLIIKNPKYKLIILIITIILIAGIGIILSFKSGDSDNQAQTTEKQNTKR